MAAETQVPGFDKLMWPAMCALKQMGGSASHQELLDKVIELAKIPEDVQNISHTGGVPQTRGSRSGARYYSILMDAFMLLSCHGSMTLTMERPMTLGPPQSRFGGTGAVAQNCPRVSWKGERNDVPGNFDRRVSAGRSGRTGRGPARPAGVGRRHPGRMSVFGAAQHRTEVGGTAQGGAQWPVGYRGRGVAEGGLITAPEAASSRPGGWASSAAQSSQVSGRKWSQPSSETGGIWRYV